MSLTPPAEALQNDPPTGAWKDAASGLAIGGVFALGMALLAGGYAFAPSASAFTSLPVRMIMSGAAGCIAALLAFAATFVPALRGRIGAALLSIVFIGAAGFAGLTVLRDLTMNGYNTRVHASLRLEDISSTSPALNERTNYRIYYALNRRIAASRLSLDPDFPLDNWHMLYRADLQDVRRQPASELPAAPSAQQVASWLGKGGMDLPLAAGGRLVISPNVAALRSPQASAAFAVVKVDDKTYALVNQGSASQ
ncbi:MAG TPA: hypothetical protein VGO52_00995 [Hyphomonadaceae bacterium]|jgi:hypothetical protein|nr:hypothetical protein [Hyphomonadaceae bacterium]